MKEKLGEMMTVIDGYVNLLLHHLHIRRNDHYAERLAIGRECPHRRWKFCGECGCVIVAKCCTDYPISEKDGLSIGGCPLNPPSW